MVVLLADDNRLLLSVLSTVLRDAGHEVLAADSGQKALEHINRRRPDAAILDLYMPLVSGAEVAAECKTRDIPFVFISAYDETEISATASMLGARGYLLKPTTKAAMLSALDRCSRGEAGGELRCE